MEPLTYCSEERLDRGAIVEITLRNKSEEGVVLTGVPKPEFDCLAAKKTSRYLTLQMLSTAEFIAKYYICSAGEAAALFVPFEESSSQLPQVRINSDIKLSKLQCQALDFTNANDISLLFGDTGSGKTEIYMKLFEQMINSDKSAIFLMPEISLTPQMEQRLKVHFGNSFAMWHSKQGKKKKEQILASIKSGEVRLVAGPRSALFLPMKDIGVVVVDEEHDDAFKSQNRPRYNARDVAIYMGSKFSIKVVLGSATPSTNSYHKYPSFRLKEQFYRSNKKISFSQKSGEVDDRLLRQIEKSVLAKKQAIVFLPTRANYKYISCKACKELLKCPFCTVGMSLHKNEAVVRCHYCGFAKRVPKECESCGEELNSFRIGTAEVEEAVKNALSNVRVARFDKDEITTDTKLKKVISEFNDAKIDVLIGTQMLTKGHDYHAISFAAVLGIDSVLAMPDYRARERALQLVVQLIGRAGRKDDAEVLVQTLNDNFFKQYLPDYELFLKDELRLLSKLYPPFKRLARIVFSDKTSSVAKDRMSEALTILKGYDVEIVGHGEAAIEKIAAKFRFDILLRSDKAASLLNAAHAVKHLKCEIDIDPVSFS